MPRVVLRVKRPVPSGGLHHMARRWTAAIGRLASDSRARNGLAPHKNNGIQNVSTLIKRLGS